MKKSSEKSQRKKKVYEVTTFPVPFTLGENQGNVTITTNHASNSSKEQIINEAIKFHLKGNITEAIKYYKYCLNQGINDHKVFSNYGTILKDLGKLHEAESFLRKAIALNPNFADGLSNLGTVLKDLGKLHEAESSLRKAIELNPDFANAYLNLGAVLKDLGKLHEAESSLRKAIELNPDFANAYLNLGAVLKDLGKLHEAESSLRKAIELNPDSPEAHSNLGNILRDLGKLQDAELSTRKAIDLNPCLADAHLNLGSILKDLGKLQDAELSTRKAIDLNPDFTKAYYSLSILKYSDDNKIWQDQLFSESFLNNKLKKDQINIYFAKANILHKRKKYEKSAQYLKLANRIKLDCKKSNSNDLINKSEILLLESDKKDIHQKKTDMYPQNIFIVGMPRSGSTLLESIISMNNDVFDLGEVNILEESYLEKTQVHQGLTLAELYWSKVTQYNSELKITTNKMLYNYQYTGIIASQIPNALIIHCYRNPLDNILSIYRAHFSTKNEYSSSLVDCSKVYLDQEKMMAEYKNRFRSKIYDLNYDLLVNNPNQEIKSLISWLGWQWDDSYLTPHLNPRSVSTASSVQVRSPINSKSIGGWKNYKDMLKPAIEILTKADRYRDLIA